MSSLRGGGLVCGVRIVCSMHEIQAPFNALILMPQSFQRRRCGGKHACTLKARCLTICGVGLRMLKRRTMHIIGHIIVGCQPPVTLAISLHPHVERHDGHKPDSPNQNM
jgi:hypothetical protein